MSAMKKGAIWGIAIYVLGVLPFEIVYDWEFLPGIILQLSGFFLGISPGMGITLLFPEAVDKLNIHGIWFDIVVHGINIVFFGLLGGFIYKGFRLK